MLRAGKFNCRIVIETRTIGKGASGGIVESWVPVTPLIWATRSSKSGFERPATSAGGEVEIAREEFWLYWRPDISAEMRVLCDGEYFNIKHANAYNGARKALILTCETGINHG